MAFLFAPDIQEQSACHMTGHDFAVAESRQNKQFGPTAPFARAGLPHGNAFR
jgi:hypothetical protein